MATLWSRIGGAVSGLGQNALSLASQSPKTVFTQWTNLGLGLAPIQTQWSNLGLGAAPDQTQWTRVLSGNAVVPVQASVRWTPVAQTPVQQLPQTQWTQINPASIQQTRTQWTRVSSVPSVPQTATTNPYLGDVSGLGVFMQQFPGVAVNAPIGMNNAWAKANVRY